MTETAPAVRVPCLSPSLLSLSAASILPPAFPLSLDNPGGRINDDEWISDDDERGKDVGWSTAAAAAELGQLSVL